MKRKVLLGKTTENTIVFAEISNTNYFSVSFNEVAPVVATEEYLKERLESMLECYSKEDLYNKCEFYDCKPSELLEKIYEDNINSCYGVEGILDISLYPESYNVYGVNDDIYFESVSGGQVDIRDRLIPIEKTTVDYIFNAWDKYHLKTIPENILITLIELLDLYQHKSLPTEEDWIQSFLDGLYKEYKTKEYKLYKFNWYDSCSDVGFNDEIYITNSPEVHAEYIRKREGIVDRVEFYEIEQKSFKIIIKKKNNMLDFDWKEFKKSEIAEKSYRNL